MIPIIRIHFTKSEGGMSSLSGFDWTFSQGGNRQTVSPEIFQAMISGDADCCRFCLLEDRIASGSKAVEEVVESVPGFYSIAKFDAEQA